MPHPGLMHPEPLPLWQASADPYLHRRHRNTQRQVWLSLCGVSWYTAVFLWALQASLACMGFDSKRDFFPPTIWLGLLLCLWTWGIFFGGGPNILLSMIVKQRAVILEFSQEKMSELPSFLPSLHFCVKCLNFYFIVSSRWNYQPIC